MTDISSTTTAHVTAPLAPPSIWSQTPETLRAWAGAKGEARFRADQIIAWIYQKHVISAGEMTNLSTPLRTALATEFSWHLPEIVSSLTADDGATKLLLKTAKGQLIESVILRYDGRTSLCVSSQVGCKLACAFCQTGKLGFFRNLEAGEIVAQYVIAQAIVAKEGRRLSHIVFMGMGEPLDNFNATVQAVNQFTGPEGFGLSARHVTISSSGLAPRIRELPGKVRAALAISLHAARDELRTELMPINRKYDLAELKDAMLHYQAETGDIITIEYLLIKGKNSTARDAKELVRYLHGLRAKINLIPFNPHPGLPFDKPDPAEIRQFQLYLSERSFAAPVRYSKGLDVSGACGQLAAKHVEQLKSVPQRLNVLQ